MKIKELKISTSDLPSQVDFYSQVLGLKVQVHDEFEAVIQIGNSKLVLVANEKSTPYHYAINIPGDSVEQALGNVAIRL